MSEIRPELSKNSKYWIPRNRYYELKYFCLQYQDYKDAYHECITNKSENVRGQRIFADPTGNLSVYRDRIITKMKHIEQSAMATDPELASYILEAVTTGASYTYLSTVKRIPCCRNVFYDRYRRFFWILDASFSMPIIE